MPNTPKILGQSNPSAATSTDLYTVPAATNTVGSSVVVCNRSAVGTTFRLSVARAGAVLSNEQYLVFDGVINGSQTLTITIGITLEATDKVRVFATLATLSFNLFGTEIS